MDLKHKKLLADVDGFTLVLSGKKKGPKQTNRLPVSDGLRSEVSLENFDEVLKTVQDELRNSDFFSRFREVLSSVLCEWNLDRAEDSTNGNAFNELDDAEGTGKKLQHIDIVCYGLGSFSFCYIAQYQLGFLLILKRILHSVLVDIYDPLFSEGEKEFLKRIGLNVLDINEEAKRTLKGKSVFFMPHCDLPLYNNLLWANWSAKKLAELAIIGNSFQGYELNDARGQLKETAKYVYLANKFATEIKIDNVFRMFDVFNDLCIHYFKSSSLSSVDSHVWLDLREPEYADGIFIKASR